MARDEPFVLEVETPIGLRVRCSEAYWHLFTSAKHPVMRDRLAEVVQALHDPDQVRESSHDANVLLLYRRSGRYWTCVVVLSEGSVGYVITAYPANRLKAGPMLWTK